MMIAMDENRPKPWERQPKETTQAFNAFTHYLALTPPRTARNVATALGRSYTLIHRWSSNWHWIARADAYDVLIAEQAMGARIEAVRQMQERHIQLSMSVQTLLARRLQQLLAPAADGTFPNLARLSPSSIASLLESSVKLERLSRGETTENVGHTDAPATPTGPHPLTALVLSNPEAMAYAAGLARLIGGESSAPALDGSDARPDRNDLARFLGRVHEPGALPSPEAHRPDEPGPHGGNGTHT